MNADWICRNRTPRAGRARHSVRAAPGFKVRCLPSIAHVAKEGWMFLHHFSYGGQVKGSPVAGRDAFRHVPNFISL